MRILVTNDDGIDAKGLEVLVKIANEISDDVWVVAPETNQSGVSHAITLHHPIRMREISERRFAVQGTPTDCVLMGVHEILKDKTPDLVLSGVNRGQNIADDVTYSGTIAGAMEGIILGIPSIALSQAYDFAGGGPFMWETSEKLGAEIVKKLIASNLSNEVLVNINFPNVPPEEVLGVQVTTQGRRDQNVRKVDVRQDTSGRTYYWFNFQRNTSEPEVGTDLWAVYNGYISVTPLFLNLTHTKSCEKLKNIFS